MWVTEDIHERDEAEEIDKLHESIGLNDAEPEAILIETHTDQTNCMLFSSYLPQRLSNCLIF